MNWNSLRQPHAVAIIVALLVHGTADAQGSASEILVPAKITSVLTTHSRLFGTTCYRKREEQLFEQWWQLKVAEPQFKSIKQEFIAIAPQLDEEERGHIASLLAGEDARLRFEQRKYASLFFPKASADETLRPWIKSFVSQIRQTQAKFFPILRNYIEATERFERLTDAESKYADSECRSWNRKDPRILPYVRRLLRDGLKKATEDAYNARFHLEALSSREFVDEVDKNFGHAPPWEKITVQAFSMIDKQGFTKPILPSSIVQQLRESPDIKEYTHRAKRKFWNSTYALEILPVLLIEIARSGKVKHVHVIKPTANTATDEQAVKIAADMPLPALPKSYTGTCWYILLSDLNDKPWPPISPFVPAVPRKNGKTYPRSHTGVDTKLDAALQYLRKEKHQQQDQHSQP